MSVSITAKATRLLAAGAVHVRYLDRDHITASVDGDTATWAVRYCPDTGWTCACLARRTCSHITATELCTTRRRVRQPVPALTDQAGGRGFDSRQLH